MTDSVDAIVDLANPRISATLLHPELEDLDQAGFAPHHLHTLDAATIAGIDLRFGGTLGSRLAGGGAWLIVPKSAGAELHASAVNGVGGYLGADTAAPRLAEYAAQGDLGIAGPFVLEGPLRPFRVTVTRAVLFALRERGYRRALLPRVKRGAVEALRAAFGTAAVEVRELPGVAPLRTVVLASGNGSNAQAFIDGIAAGRLPYEIAGAVINRASAFAVERMRRAQIPVELAVWDRTCETRAAYDERLRAAVRAFTPRVVVLLGWMHVLAANFFAEFPDVLNIHPAYLPLDPRADAVDLPDGSRQPAFRGARAIDDALAANAAWIGASVHHVTAAVDRGGILGRIPIARDPQESRAILDRRLHTAEHELLGAALERYAQER